MKQPKRLLPSDPLYEEYSGLSNTLAQALNPACWYDLAEIDQNQPEAKADIVVGRNLLAEAHRFIGSAMHRAMKDTLDQA